MTDQTPAFIRTLVPFVVGYLATRYGFDKSDPLLSSAVGYGFYVIVHLVEMKAPRLGWLLGVAKQPAYSSEPAPSPGEGENVEAVVVADEGHSDVDTVLLVLAVVGVFLLLVGVTFR